MPEPADESEHDRRRFGAIYGPRLQLEAARLAEILTTRTGRFVFENVDILGDLDLQEAQVAAAARFVDCTFSGVRAERATFRGSLFFLRCKIGQLRGHHARFDDLRIIGGNVKEVGCANAIVEKTISFRNVSIGRIELNSCRIAGNLRIRKVTTERLSAQRAAVDGILDLRELNAKRLDIDGLHADRIIGTGLRLSSSASFDRIEIKDQVDLTDANITCSLAMRAAVIGDDLYFGNAEIHGLDLSGSRVEDSLFLDGTFIRGDLMALGGTFGHCECSAKVLGAVQIMDATFNTARFIDIRVQGELNFVRNTVSGTLTIASGGTIVPTIGEQCSFAGTRVGGQVLITNVEVSGQFSMISMTATDIILRAVRVRKNLNLTGASASLSVALRKCIVYGGISLRSISTTRLSMSDSSCESILAESAIVKGSASFESVDVLDFAAVHAHITATLRLDGARIARSLDLTRADVGNLQFGSKLDDVPDVYSFPKVVQMRNCRYGSIQGRWMALLASLQEADEYESTAYRALEEFMRSVGRSDWADSIYLSSKVHAARMLQSGTKRFAQSVLEWISGYGARPLRLLRAFAIILASMAFILFIAAQFYPRLLVHGQEPFGMLLSRACFMSLDVLVKGDRSAVFTQASGPKSSMILQAVLNVVTILRYIALALIGLWVAYVSGLVRYIGARS